MLKVKWLGWLTRHLEGLGSEGQGHRREAGYGQASGSEYQILSRLCITSKHQALCNGGIVVNEVYPRHEVPVARTAPMHCPTTWATTQQSCCSSPAATVLPYIQSTSKGMDAKCPIKHHSWRKPTNLLVACCYTGLHPLQKGQKFTLIEIYTYYTFLILNASACNTIWEPPKYLSHKHA